MNINYGDPEPDRDLELVDPDGNVWEWSDITQMWTIPEYTTPETAYFKWNELQRWWFPMRAIG